MVAMVALKTFMQQVRIMQQVRMTPLTSALEMGVTLNILQLKQITIHREPLYWQTFVLRSQAS